jgi:hypothetical protein
MKRTLRKIEQSDSEQSDILQEETEGHSQKDTAEQDAESEEVRRIVNKWKKVTVSR